MAGLFNYIVQMTGDYHQIQVPIVIEVQKMRAPTHKRTGQPSQPRAHGLLVEREAARVDEESMPLIVKVSDHERRPAVTGHIACVRAHARACYAIGVERNLRR